MTIVAAPTPGERLVLPEGHTPVLIDFQSQMAFTTSSIDAVTLRNNAALVSRAAGFGVSTILTTVAERASPARCSRRPPLLDPNSGRSTAPL
jgi:hypothetical protein